MATMTAIENPFQAGTIMVVPAKPCQAAILFGERTPLVTILHIDQGQTSGNAHYSRVTLSTAQANILLLTLPQALAKGNLKTGLTVYVLRPISEIIAGIAPLRENPTMGLREGSGFLNRIMRF